jgi:hypothetical protein
MSIFKCEECDIYRDSDLEGYESHPMTGKELCERCYYEIYTELGKD